MVMHNPLITFRRLDHTDAAEYRAIRLECLKAYPENFGSTYEEQRKLPKLMFEKALEQPIDDRFVMGAIDQTNLDQKDLIGICGFVPLIPDSELKTASSGIIIQVYVKAAYSGKRVGLGLLKATTAEAFKTTAVTQIILGVREGNMSAIRVYEQAGFETYTPPNANSQDGDTRHMILYRYT